MKKTALIYYSYSGNIKKVAQMIIDIEELDSYEIIPEVQYPMDISSLIPIVKHEVDNMTGRRYLPIDFDINEYDQIILATPNWGDTIAPPLLTYLRDHNFNNKNIYVIATHQGTGLGNISIDIEKETGEKVIDSYVDYHERTTSDSLKKWLSKLK